MTFATLDRFAEQPHEVLPQIATEARPDRPDRPNPGTRRAARAGCKRSAVVERLLVSVSILPPSPDHRALVGRYQDTLKRLIKLIPDLLRWCVAFERIRRAGGAGGSVATTLFVGETLEAVKIDRNRAWRGNGLGIARIDPDECARPFEAARQQPGLLARTGCHRPSGPAIRTTPETMPRISISSWRR
ncbi:hypothetical protein ABC977_11170 [Thioalkalicoccus limnaeus]|uniref:Uncharacterized protein n=1 Tax=Thioalkalicoccus limnaeus TaxID=120681 RepID=A0ABV4BFB5_9GAMM